MTTLAVPHPVLTGMNTKTKGNTSELKALMFLHQHSYSIALPYGENCPYDIVAESHAGNVYRVQCRTLRKSGNSLLLELRCVSKNYHRSIDFKRVDSFIGVYADRFFVIPTRLLTGKTMFTIRLAPALNGQRYKTHPAVLFENALVTQMP